MKYVKVTRSDVGGNYYQPLTEIGGAISGEFDGSEPGDKITLELSEMTEDEFNKLPEFQGW